MNGRIDRFARALLAALFGVLLTLTLAGAGACEALRFDKTAALTFDDGPHGDRTLELLTVLADEGVKASFFVVGLDLGLFDMGLKSRLKELAEDTGGEAFFIGGAKELPAIYRQIETEVRSQYFLSYLTESKKGPDELRTVEVRVAKPGLRAKTIRGYFP